MFPEIAGTNLQAARAILFLSANNFEYYAGEATNGKTKAAFLMLVQKFNALAISLLPLNPNEATEYIKAFKQEIADLQSVYEMSIQRQTLREEQVSLRAALCDGMNGVNDHLTDESEKAQASLVELNVLQTETVSTLHAVTDQLTEDLNEVTQNLQANMEEGERLSRDYLALDGEQTHVLGDVRNLLTGV